MSSDAGLRLNRTISEADSFLAGLNDLDGQVPSPDKVRDLVTRLREETSPCSKSVVGAQVYLEDASKLGDAGKVLVGQISDLREQILQVYELIGLGVSEISWTQSTGACCGH